MANSNRQKIIKSAKKATELKEELQKNDEILRKNIEHLNRQIQVGLYNKGYPQGSPMFDNLLTTLKLKVKESDLKIKTEFRMINPAYEFQTMKEWKDIQIEQERELQRVNFDNIKEIEENVEKVRQDITEQTERITARRNQILEQLKDMGQDVADYSAPDYIH